MASPIGGVTVPTVGSIAYQIVANTTDFKAGVVATRAELRTLKDTFLQSQTPAERFSTAIAHLEQMAAKFPTRAEHINRVIGQMRQEMAAASPEAQRLAAEKERLAQRSQATQAILGRFGLVLDPISAGFMAIHTASGLARTGLQLVESATGAVYERMKDLDDLAKRSRTLGIDPAALVGLRRAAADISGVEASAFDTGITMFARRLGEAAIKGGEADEALNRLGLSAHDLTRMSADKAFLTVADAISRVGNQSERLQLSYQLLGRQGAELATTLSVGGDEIRKLMQDQENLSQIGFLDLAAIEEANDEIGRTSELFMGMLSLLASDLAPLVRDVARDITSGFQDATSNGESLRDVTREIAQAMATLVDTMEMVVSNGAKLNSVIDPNGVLASFLISNSGGTLLNGLETLARADPNSRLNQMDAARAARPLPGLGGTGSQSAIAEEINLAEQWSAIADERLEHYRNLAKAEEAANRETEKRIELEERRARTESSARRDAEAAAQRVVSETRTPAERLNQRFGELRGMMLDADTRARALERLESDAEGIAGGGARMQSVGAVRAGTVEALRAQFGKNTAEEALKEAKKQTKEQEMARGLLTQIRDAIADNAAMGVAE